MLTNNKAQLEFQQNSSSDSLRKSRSKYAALLLARRYCDKWSEICLIRTSPEPQETFLIGDYRVIQLDKPLTDFNCNTLIQNVAAEGYKVIILESELESWKTKALTTLAQEPIPLSGFFNKPKEILLLITIQHKTSYVLIEVGKSKH